ncbi:S26 family signal peptidase [Peribacillus frigoritolerans]|nr:S26 family signal peptidase [Peribacillus frigoritolerans]
MLFVMGDNRLNSKDSRIFRIYFLRLDCWRSEISILSITRNRHT